MKLFSASILASAAATVMGQAPGPTPLSPSDLLTRWDMTTPNITYNSSENKFTLDFETASTQNYLDGLQEGFYDVNCKDDGSGFGEYETYELFSNPNASTPGYPMMGKHPTTLRPQLQFVIDTQAAANDPKVYSIVGASGACDPGQTEDVYFAPIALNVDMDLAPFEVFIDIIEKASGDVVYHLDETNFTGYSKITIPNLCRGVDYIFNYTDTEGDGLDGGEGVEATYNSSGTPDVIFRKSNDEIGSGFETVFNLPLNPQNPATNVQGRDGQGMMKFCVRSSLGYGSKLPIAVFQNKTLDWQIDEGFQEVNFIESLITIFFNLTAGFSVLEFNVDPKERVETTVVKDTYNLVAWLCKRNNEEGYLETFPFANTADKVVPKRISDTFLADEPDESKEYFNQGALITVCVSPDDAAWRDGIRMNGINTFDWRRTDLDLTAAELEDTGDITQPAIVINAVTGIGEGAPNGLTSYTSATCTGGKDYCTFSSILFADFYVSRGTASGSGSANLVFGAPGTRRLGGPEEETTGRKLQEDESESPFDVSVPVDLTDTGPAGLKTAGGASYGITALASILALLGAALLA